MTLQVPVVFGFLIDVTSLTSLPIPTTKCQTPVSYATTLPFLEFDFTGSIRILLATRTKSLFTHTRPSDRNLAKTINKIIDQCKLKE